MPEQSSFVTLSEQVEVWRDVPGFPNYQVSDQGRVRSRLRRGRPPKDSTRQRQHPPTLLKPRTTRLGYATVAMNGSDGVFGRLVHRLVLEAFVGPCPEGQQCCHYDGDKLNNRLSNFRWGTPLENAADSIRLGKMASKLDHDQVLDVYRRWCAGESTAAIADDLKVKRASVAGIISGKRRRSIPPPPGLVCQCCGQLRRQWRASTHRDRS